MDSLPTILYCFTLSSLFLSTLYHFFYRFSHIKGNAPLPPGTTGWPWVGESLRFLMAARQGKPERFVLDRLSKYAPHRVFKTSFFGEKVAVMCGVEANKFLFSNENKAVNLWWPPSFDKLFMIHPSRLPSIEETKKARYLVTEFVIKPEHLRHYVPVMDEYTRRFVASGAWGPSERLEAFRTAKEYTFSLVSKIFLSLDALEDPSSVASLFIPFTKLLNGIVCIPLDIPGFGFHTAMNASRELRKKIGDLITKRKAEIALQSDQAVPMSNVQDVLSMVIRSSMITNEKDKHDSVKPRTVADLTMAFRGVLHGSFETTSTTITFILKYLAELPHVYDAVYKEQIAIAEAKAPGELLTWEDLQKMKYSWNVACEVMRLSPPSQGSFRQAITDFNYGGFHIPKGWKIHWNAHATQRDPNCFPEPEKFDPTRFEGFGPQPYSFVPFGGGPRMCPGQEYARIKVLVFMHNIVTKFRWEKLIPDEKITFITLPVPANGLPLRMIPHEAI